MKDYHLTAAGWLLTMPVTHTAIEYDGGGVNASYQKNAKRRRETDPVEKTHLSGRVRRTLLTLLAAILTAAADLSAGEYSVEDFANSGSWRLWDNGKLIPSVPITDGWIQIHGPRKIYYMDVRNYPLGGVAEMNKRYSGIAFKVRGDGSDEWGRISISAGLLDGGSFYFPLRKKDIVEYRVAFSDMAPNDDNSLLPSATIALGEITEVQIGDRWQIGPNNYPRQSFSYEISDLRLLDDIQGKFTPGKFRPSPLDAVIAKLRKRRPVLILCFGDSITAGTGLHDREKHRYATVLQKFMRYEYGYDEIIVRSVAVGGARTCDLIGWMDRDLFGCRPDMAVIMIGYNNRSARQSRKNYAAQLERWIELFAMKTAGNAAVVLMPPPQGVPRFFAQQDMADATYEIGRKYGLTVVPLDKEISAIGPVKYRQTYLSDAIHPNPGGHKLFAEILLRSIKGQRQQLPERNDISIPDIKPTPTPKK